MYNKNKSLFYRRVRQERNKKMNEIMINNMPLSIKEYEGKRVVTLKDIDMCHKRPEGTARRNFNTNKEHFIEGEDFFKVCANEIRTHKIIDISPKVHEDVTLITESGYYMLVKSFTDDLSWDVQRQLVNSYFKVSKPELPQMSAMEMIAAIAGNAAKLEKKCAELERKFNGIERDRDTINDILVEQDTTLKETKETIDEAKEKIENVCSTISLDKGEWRKNTHKLVVKISRMFPDLYKNVGMVYNELYKLLEARAGVNLNARLRHMKSRMKKEGVSESKISLKNNIDVIAEDKKLTEIYIAIVKELAVNLGMGKIGL